MYKNYLGSLCNNLKKIGININTIPVLDVLRKSTNKIIGNRSFSSNEKIVKILGETAVKKCHSSNIAAVIKHIPGHGCSSVDSHLHMPKVNLSMKTLNKKDFYPFKSSSAKLAMTAHILYSKIDSENISTFSRKIIQNVIRDKIGFNGILITYYSIEDKEPSVSKTENDFDSLMQNTAKFKNLATGLKFIFLSI